MEPTPRASPPLTRLTPTWEEQAFFALELLCLALEQLQSEQQSDPDFPVDEVQVSLRLGLHLHRLISRHTVESGLTSPSFDGIQGRDTSPTSSSGHELKRPDIRWWIADPQEIDEEHKQKQLVAECKRLGRSVSGHSLNTEYVTEGIARFRNQSHRYAAHSTWAIMIGYVETSDFDTILQKVNAKAQANGFPVLALVDTEWQRAISRLEHRFERPFPAIFFHLRHLWVDLRVVPST